MWGFRWQVGSEGVVFWPHSLPVDPKEQESSKLAAPAGHTQPDAAQGCSMKPRDAQQEIENHLFL